MFTVVEERDSEGNVLGWAVYRGGKRVSEIFDNPGDAEAEKRRLDATEEPDFPTEMPPAAPKPF